MALSAAHTAGATNGHQLMGVGVYQNSMGGATTAAPHDTTTAVSNPAGLALIETRADFNFEGFFPTRTADFKGSGGQENQGGSPMYLIPSVGWVGPVSDDGSLVFGGGMFMVSGMGVDYDTINTLPMNAPYGDMTPWKGNLYSQYQFWKLAPTLAKKINDQLSVGVALNVDYQQMAFKQIYFDTKSRNYIGADLSRAVGAMGFGVTAGVIYKASDMIQLGATYTSAQSFADMEYRLSAGDIVMPTGTGTMMMNDNGSYKLKMDFPQQVAVGLAITPADGFLVTADYKWINFASAMEKLDLKGKFNIINPQTGAGVGSVDAMPLPFGWKDVNVMAVGVSYQVTPATAVRAGYNKSDSPIGPEDVFNNMVFPAIVEDHVGLGVDLRLGANWSLGLAYTKAFRKEIAGKSDMMGQTSGAKIALEEQSMMLSISYNYGK